MRAAAGGHLWEPNGSHPLDRQWQTGSGVQLTADPKKDERRVSGAAAIQLLNTTDSTQSSPAARQCMRILPPATVEVLRLIGGQIYPAVFTFAG